MRDWRSKLVALAIWLCPAVVAAQIQVSGQVTEAGTGTPLPGVTVMVKNTSTGTVTDLDGNYTLEVPDGDAVLVFSFLGYRTTEVPVQGRSRIDVELEEDIQELEEVVVVGYGVQKKSVVTGAIAKVKAEELEDMPLTRIEQSLQGRTSGVLVTNTSGQPGAGAVVRIRGTTTINNSDPLYVVDGVPIGGGIDYLAQGDIESIEVLKDAASAAVYGARAANGVILVTTKKGKQGQARLNYSTYYGVQNPWRKLSLLNAREYAILMNESFAAAGDDIPFPDPDALGEGTDWQDEVFHYNAPITNHELSLTAGNDQSSYFASFSYLDQEGIVSQSDSRYQRLTARINSTHKVGSRFNFGQTLSYTRTRGVSVAENTEFGSPLSRAINIDPITPVYETDPDELADPRYANNWDALVRDDQGRIFAISKYVTSEIVNPVAALLVQQGYGWSDKIVGNVFAEYELFEGLKLRSSVGADIAFWGGESFTPIHHLNASNFATQTSYSRGQNRGLYLILENTISYQKMFGAHDLAIVAGTSAERNRGQGQSGSVTDLPVDNIDDASLALPVAPDNQFFWGYEYETRLASYFGRINYNFAQKYLLSVVLRVDGSSKFGTNNKFGFFPSVSLGWVVSEEPFWAASSPVKFLKLRGSWGVNGNNQIGDFLYASTVGGGRYYTFGVGDVLTDGVSPNAIANPDLRWEQTTQTNFGFDARLFRHWSLTFDYYRKETTDMLLGVEVPGYVGNVGPVGNIASMFNEGLELEVGFDKKVGEWNLSLSANGSHVRNEVTFLTNEKTFLPGQRFGPQGLEITRTTVGYPIGHFFGYKTNGIFQTEEEVLAYTNADGDPLQPDAAPGDFRWVDVNGDGQINEDDRTFIGDPTPSWTYGGTANVSWRNFELTLFAQGVAGNQIYNATRRFDLPAANYRADALGRWTGPGSTNEYPRLIKSDPNRNFSRSSDFHVESGAYFRIKTLQLAWNLPAETARRLGMQRAKVYVMANNLYTITKYTGFDPEIGASFGVDRGIYPQPRSYLAGINVTF